MRAVLARSIMAVLITAVAFISSHAGRAPAGNAIIAAIDADASAGQITYETALRYKLYTVLDLDRLPTKYRTLDSRLVKCGTPYVLEALAAAPSLSTSFQSELEAMADRPAADSIYTSPRGWFQIHYNLTGTNAVSATDADSSGRPDFIEKLALYFDSSWSHQVETLLWTRPPSDGTAGGDSLYDIYPTSLGLTYGITWPESPGPEPWSDYTSYIVVNKSFLGFPPNDDPDGDQAGAMKVTAAHEFNHACQFGDSPLQLKATESWCQELTATWMEDVVYDASNDNYNFLDDFFTVPAMSLFDNGDHKYGAFVFGEHIEETFGAPLMRDIWLRMRYATAVASIDSALMGEGSGFRSVFGQFGSWNYFTGSRDLGLHYQEGSAYPLMPVTRVESVYPITNRSGASLQAMSADYIEFLPDGTGRDVVELKFNGSGAVKWRATAQMLDSLGNLSSTAFALDSTTGDGAIHFGNFNHLAKVTLATANVNMTAATAGYTYSFRFLLRADCNDDGGLSIFDVLYLSDFIYANGPSPLPIWQVGDMNCSGDLDILDISLMIDYILKGGPAPCAPL